MSGADDRKLVLDGVNGLVRGLEGHEEVARAQLRDDEMNIDEAHKQAARHRRYLARTMATLTALRVVQARLREGGEV